MWLLHDTIFCDNIFRFVSTPMSIEAAPNKWNILLSVLFILGTTSSFYIIYTILTYPRPHAGGRRFTALDTLSYENLAQTQRIYIYYYIVGSSRLFVSWQCNGISTIYEDMGTSRWNFWGLDPPPPSSKILKSDIEMVYQK